MKNPTGKRPGGKRGDNQQPAPQNSGDNGRVLSSSARTTNQARLQDPAKNAPPETARQQKARVATEGVKK